ncbi:carbon monoxide dehydrogenase [Pseudonocardia sulfidoxydans NBRC 16205]|uniref:Carbon monoxide dehydrogenase n=2 Tax=Pseudonocardia sulfidoxydans TaxID=54011 RepID=A0A511DQQ3_9PSEU|nr:carbon monoxide dehydrogenase [Pseudonocardia sulfidoxydans NBRC 16205]
MPRSHDARLLRGDGRYIDDIDDTGVLHAAIVRSPQAHGRITRFDASQARAHGASVLVLGPDEIREVAGPLPLTWQLPGQHLSSIELAVDTVRYVGQPIGIVVAPTRALAEDVAEMIQVDIEPLPVVVTLGDAIAADAPLLYPEHASNIAGEIHFGTPVDALEAALAASAHVVEREFTIQRINPSPMEPRGVLAEWIPSIEQLTVHASSQAPHLVRQELSAALRLRADQIRVVVPDVGGAFGAKTTMLADEALACLAAKVLGRRVKWIEDRTENLTACYQGRGQRARCRLGLDADGHFTALAVHILGDLGALLTTAGSGPFQVAALTVEGPYKFEAAGASVTAVFTNAVPTGAYRGYGMQESAWIRERIVEEAARELGRNAVELRLLNMIGPDDMPFATHTTLAYDSGDYPAALRRAAEIGLQRRRPSTDRVRRGVAVTANVEVTGFAPSALLQALQIQWSGYETGTVRVNDDGSVTVFSGVNSMGQGIETTLAQIVADELGVPIELVSVQLGDTHTAAFSNFSSQASRSLPLAGAALIAAGGQMRDRMHRLAASALGVVVEDIKQDGLVFEARSVGSDVTWQQVAHLGWMGWGRPDAERIVLEETVSFDPPGIAYAYSAHGAAVAVDLDTGKVTVEEYWTVNDSGVLVNPLIVDGQIIGGVAQGLGTALLEEACYEPETGQPLATSYLDYVLPLSEDMPDVTVEHMETPSPHITGGFKGVGESGIQPPAATIGNAIADAVPEIAAGLVATPMSPSCIWTLLAAADMTGDR